EPADVLELSQTASLAKPATGQVRIRVLARPVIHGDLNAIRGKYRTRRSSAEIPPSGAPVGYEGMGMIEEVDPDVDPSLGLSSGQRVAFFPGVPSWSEQLFVDAAFVTTLPA